MKKFIPKYILLSFLLSWFSGNMLFAQNQYKSKVFIQGNYNQERRMKIEVYDNDKTQYEVNKILAPDLSIPDVTVMSNKNLVICHGLEGFINIIDQHGNSIYTKQFYNLPPYNEQKILISKTYNGIYFLISEKNINRLYYLNNKCEMESEIQVEDGVIFGLKASWNNGPVAYSIVKWSSDNYYFISRIRSGKSVNILPDEFSKGRFNTDQTKFVGFTNKNIFSYDLINSKVEWIKNVDASEFILDAEFSGNDLFIVRSSNPEFNNNMWLYDNIEVVTRANVGTESVISVIPNKYQNIEFEKLDKKIRLNLDGNLTDVKSE